jgi:hypothetical protein
MIEYLLPASTSSQNNGKPSWTGARPHLYALSPIRIPACTHHRPFSSFASCKQAMKKDIRIPKVEDVSMAVVRETDGPEADWGVYLINRKHQPLKDVIVSSKGYGELNGEKVATSELRHYFDDVKGDSFVKVERIVEEVFGLNNQYFLTFYINGEIYDRKFIFVPGSVADENLIHVPLVERPGILIR